MCSEKSTVGDRPFPQKLYIHCRTEWKWEIECNRCHAFCLWEARLQTPIEESTFRLAFIMQRCPNWSIIVPIVPLLLLLESLFIFRISSILMMISIYCFSPTPSFEIIPNSVVVISRVAYQNNTSKYFINNKSSSASEVTSLLQQRGIDLDNNRFLILQGEVEQISLMKPKVLSRLFCNSSVRMTTRRDYWSI